MGSYRNRLHLCCNRPVSVSQDKGPFGQDFENYGTLYSSGHQRGTRGHQVTRKDQAGRPRACSKYNKHDQCVHINKHECLNN